MTNGRSKVISPPKGNKASKEKADKKNLYNAAKCTNVSDISLDIDPIDGDDVDSLRAMFEKKLSEMKAEYDHKFDIMKAENDGKVDGLYNVLRQKDDIIGKLQTEIGELKSSYSFLTTETTELKQQIKSNELKIDNNIRKTTVNAEKSVDLEDRSRRNNLVFFGFPEDSNTHEPENCERKVINLLESRKFFDDDYIVYIDRAHRLGRRSSDKPRPIIVRFTYFKDKQEIIKNGQKLKGCNINVSEDFSKSTIEVHKQLRNKAKAAKESFKDQTIGIINYKVTYRRVMLTYTSNKAIKGANTFNRSFSLQDTYDDVNWFIPKERKPGFSRN